MYAGTSRVRATLINKGCISPWVFSDVPFRRVTRGQFDADWIIYGLSNIMTDPVIQFTTGGVHVNASSNNAEFDGSTVTFGGLQNGPPIYYHGSLSYPTNNGTAYKSETESLKFFCSLSTLRIMPGFGMWECFVRPQQCLRRNSSMRVVLQTHDR